MVDGEGKTVVRLTIEQAEAVLSGGRRVPLAPRLSVQPVLGYDADHARTLGVLRDQLGFAPAEQALFDQAVIAGGGLPEGISTKPRVTLAPGTRTDAAATEVLTRLLEIAEVNVPGTLEDLDTEFLHDLRVSVRRARSVLRELKHVHDPAARSKLRDELKWAQAAHRAGARPRRAAARMGQPHRAAAAPSARPSSSRCGRCSRAGARER